MGKTSFSLTLTQLLKEAASENPDKEVICDDQHRMSYAELDRESGQLASALYAHGVRKGDRVGVSLPNWYECIVIYFAAAKIGAIVVPFNPRYRLQEAEFIIANADPRVVFVCKDFADVIDNETIAARTIVTVRFNYGQFEDYSTFLAKGNFMTLEGIPSTDASEPFAILYTSGSTGFPKGVMLSHQNILFTSTVTAEGLECTENDVILVPVPFFHIFGMVSCLFCTIVCRGRMVLMERFYAKEALKLIDREKVTVHHAVPTMFILELNDPDFDSFNLSSLRTGIIAASPCPTETIRQIRSRMGANICVSYGSTETAAALTMTCFDDDERLRTETVGRVVEGAEIKIVDFSGNTLPVGEIGEIVCKSPGVMIGYYNVAEQKESFGANGWFYTGDLGKLDEHGYLSIEGRKKDMIIRGGYNIYPRELEELLYTNPAVMEVVVIGIPDPVMGERICAVIKLKDSNTLSAEDIKAYLKGKLANYKIPDKIIFTGDFPVTPSGKIQRVKLKEKIITELQLHS